MIHVYKLNAYNIVLDVYSGAVHITDDVAFDAITMYEHMPKSDIARALAQKYAHMPDVTDSEIRECLSDIDELISQGKLFSRDDTVRSATEFKAQDRGIKALCLHVAHTCNLNCEYCFASQGKYKGDRALMSFNVGKRALDFLIENSGARVNLEVDFFGGEPLMNFDVVKQLVAYARARERTLNKRFRFTLTTNGVSVNDEVIEFANREMQNVVLSLDGRKETHDRYRKDFAGRGSYDIVVPKFLDFVKKRGEGDYYVRGTYTHANTDFVNDILHMADLGFTKLSMEPVVCASNEKYALTEEDMPVLLEQYELLASEMLKRAREGRPFTFYHYMLDLENGPCVYKRVSGCGSGAEYMAVTPWGELFPCHQFVGEPEYSLGDVFNGVNNERLRAEFRQCGAYSRAECADCWAKLYCSGGCAANAYHATGSINGVYEYGCRLFKKRLECAIMLSAALGDYTNNE